MNKEIIEVIQQAAQDKKANRIVTLNLEGKSDVCDAQVICSGNNSRQTVSIADEIKVRVKKELRLSPTSVEGRSNSQWIAIDYGTIIIHVFNEKNREFYALEELWSSNAPQVTFS